MPSVTDARRLTRRVGLAIDGLVAPGDRLAVAVSGGSDSVALAHLVADLSGGAAWTFAGLLHVNHGLRGAESDEDEAFCRALAARMGVAIEVRAVDVRQRAREHRQSLEAAARGARYAALEDAARGVNATRVATGHTADDQAETVLLRLLRGAASRGVAAIRRRRGQYVRPLLDCRRADLRVYLAGRGESYREDPSNLDESIPRNRLRHHVMPVLVADWPRGVAALARFADLAADDEQFLESMAHEVRTAVARRSVGGVQHFDARGLNQLPAPLARRVVRAAIEAVGGHPSYRDVEKVRALAGKTGTDAHLDLSGCEVEREGAALRFFPQRPMQIVERSFEYTLDVPGRVEIRETGDIVSASVIRGDVVRPPAGPSRAVLQMGSFRSPLSVRSRRPGDRLRPLGSPGSRKLQDLLVDRKIPRRDRDRVPIVTDDAGRIVWVAGVEVADDCRVTSPESGMVVLDLTKGNT